MVENGIDFYDDNNRAILKTMVDNNKLSMLGYANLEGKTISYDGRSLGNISNRKYFRETITGEKEVTCQYLQNTISESGPRIIFSAPAYENGKITGIVFFSKKMEVLRDNLFHQSMFRNKDSSFLVDSSGNIIVKN